MIGYNRVGNGAYPVIVLHGWLGDSAVFEPMLPALDQDRFSFAFVDYRGYGRSRQQAGEYTIAEIAGDALALADHLGWDTFGVFGHSMGGAVALKIAVDAPARVRRIIAATPVPAGGVAFEAGELGLFKGARDDEQLRQAIIDHTTGRFHTPAWSRWMARRSMESCDVEAFGSYFDAWSNSDFADAARGLPHPMLVMVGRNDLAVTAAAIEATYLADYPAARLEILNGAGHYPMQETPIHFATVIQEFFSDGPSVHASETATAAQPG